MCNIMYVQRVHRIMREVVEAPSTVCCPSSAKFSAVLLPSASPSRLSGRVFCMQRVKPKRPHQLPPFAWCRRQTTAAEFNKNHPWKLDRGGRNISRAKKTFRLMKEVSSRLSSPLPSCNPRMCNWWEISPASQIFGDFIRLRFAE